MDIMGGRSFGDGFEDGFEEDIMQGASFAGPGARHSRAPTPSGVFEYILMQFWVKG